MDILDITADGSMAGRRIGVYRLEEEVGRGGMGAVYRATRADGEFDQTVAVKLIKRGMDTDLILQRFRRERQILAALNHPNIAYFLGGGSTEDGLPYFVMEYIAGLPIYRYCDEKQLDVGERLTIFRELCWAVKAAHEMHVIHRDLKPSNILVKPDGKPKLLDFGIAKVLDPGLVTTEMDPTLTHMRAMTPEYASPEQISGGDIGPASDVYSLGVILYELLTGHRPYNLRRGAAGDAARVIREQIPTSPSGSLSRDSELIPTGTNGKASIDEVLRARNATLEGLRSALSGDLDKIILKSLRKRPEERYASAADLAEDITNYLEGRPVAAEAFPTETNERQPRHRAMSLAILPFRVLGTPERSDTADEFIGMGMADALISRLSGIQRLLVRPTTSVIPFVDADAFDAGQALGVEFVLDGSVRVSGGRIRVSIQLLEIRDRSTRWAKAFDNTTADVLSIEDRLAEQVAGSLLPHLTVEERERLEKRGTNCPDAYEAYIRGRYFWSRFTDPDLLRAVEEFKRSIELDPDYALPYIGLADYYTWAAIFGQLPSQDAFAPAMAAARRALDIDPSLGEAYAALGFAVLLSEWDWQQADELLTRALELSPHYGPAHEYRANLLTVQGREEEAAAAIIRAEELDPISPRAILMTSWVMYQHRRFDESLEKALKANAMMKEFPQGLLHLGNALTEAGRPAEAVAALRRSAELWGGSGLPRYMLAFARAREGNLEAANKIVTKMVESGKRGYIKPYFIAMGYVAIGDHDKAFEWFDRAFEERNEWMLWLGTEPKLDPIRSDPRYRDLMRRIGHPLAGTVGSPASGPQTGGKHRSIAVLPFQLIGSPQGRSDTEYISIALADALTMRLSNVRRFLVRPTSSVIPFTDRRSDAFAAGAELGVDFILDGSIRFIGEKIRVTPQLLNVRNRSTRWAASFVETLGDVLELEDSISEQVTKQLLPHLTGAERRQMAKRGTNVPEAHDAYLQGRYFWNQFTPESFPKAIAGFEKAIESDPDYALAYAGIADHYTWACIYGLVSPAEGFPKVFAAASRALEIDPELAEAHAAMGLYYSNLQKWDISEVSSRRAIELNPNYPLAHEWLSAVLVGTGRAHEGIREVLLAESLDPLSLRPKVLSAWTIYQAGEYEMALAKAREINELDPALMQGHLQIANCLLELEEPVEALEHARRAVELAPDSPLPIYMLAFALAANGKEGQARDLVSGLIRTAETTYVAPYFLAMCCVALGDHEPALDYLETAQEEHNAWMLWIGTERKLDGLRASARFRGLMHATGLQRFFPDH